MGRADLIGNGKKHLVPTVQPAGTGKVLHAPRAAAPRPASRLIAKPATLSHRKAR
jgi:hypothetical protein